MPCLRYSQPQRGSATIQQACARNGARWAGGSAITRSNALPAFRCTIALALVAIGLGLGPSALAQENGAGIDYPIPSTAREAYSPIGEGFESPIEPRENLKGPKPYVDQREPLLMHWHERLQDAGPFFRDTELKLNSRTYWFDEDAFGFDEVKVLTTGGYLTYQSGYVSDFLQLRGALYTTQPLYASSDASASLNVSPQGDQITTLGQVNARAKFAGQELTMGRQLVRTPWINPYDVRMIPITYEGVVLLPERKGQQTIDYTGSYLWRFKPRNTDKFIPMSQGLGVTQDEGVLITGARHRTKALNYGVVNYWVKDTINTAYGEFDYLLPFGGQDDDGPSFRVGINHMDQRSVGADLISNAPFATYQASARLIASYRGFVLTGAYSQVGREAELRHPFAMSASYTGMLISSFNAAGEKAFHASLSYDFSRIGLEGLSFFVGWGRGVDAIDASTGAAQPDEEEIDLRLVYEPRRGRLQGLRVELEHIDLQKDDPSLPSEELKEFRAIVNYSLPLL